MTTGTVPPETFRISALGHWFLVHVAATPEAMRAAMRRHVTSCDPNQLAAVVAVSDPKGGLFVDCAGFIFLPQSALGAGLVAHELSHAAFRLMERHGWRVEHDVRVGDATNEVEETYCKAVEELTRDFWNHAYDLGLAGTEAAAAVR
jgi:hypothetical protein